MTPGWRQSSTLAIWVSTTPLEIARRRADQSFAYEVRDPRSESLSCTHGVCLEDLGWNVAAVPTSPPIPGRYPTPDVSSDSPPPKASGVLCPGTHQSGLTPAHHDSAGSPHDGISPSPVPLMEEIDGVIERHGGWPDAFLLTKIDGRGPIRNTADLTGRKVC